MNKYSILGIIIFLALYAYIVGSADANCAKKGGQFLIRDATCVKKDSVIK